MGMEGEDDGKEQTPGGADLCWGVGVTAKSVR